MTDQVWKGCVVPDDRLYDVELNVWVALEGDEAVLGMTDVAQTLGGRIVSISWKRPGRHVVRGHPVAVVESAKWVGPFPTPLSGELVAVNRLAFDADAALANRDPYGAGWMARLRPDRLAAERDHLVDGATAYQRLREFIDSNDVHCLRCAD